MTNFQPNELAQQDIFDLIERWPGKSPPKDGGIAHPAAYHMLDVGAVSERLIRPWGLPTPIERALCFLVAIHDLGKIGHAFKAMLERGRAQVHGRHWEVTEGYLRLFDDDVLAPCLKGRADTRRQLYAAAAGHHGRPPTKTFKYGRSGTQPADAWKRMLDAAGDDAIRDAKTFVAHCAGFFPDADLGALDEAGAKALSWRLAGLATASDWIASNVEWFPPVSPGPSLAEYLEGSRCRASAAVAAAGLDTPKPGTAKLFDFPLHASQKACATVPLPEGPQLAVLEDETGSGKTEAALILARRMLHANKGRGLYFALPTMATADAMFGRVAEVLGKLYDGAPTLALAHGRAPQSDLYRSLRDARAHNPDEPGPTEWLSDNRRRALMADVGVGTIDQAVLAVVRAKHAPLRQFGLSSKILIVDEVHEMGDPYMGALVGDLLHHHASAGGSAILLSATLPVALRARLVECFEKGASREGQPSTDAAYPALTIGPAKPVDLAARPAARGPVGVQRLPDMDDAIRLLTDAVSTGAACVWIRNAVDEAIAAVGALRSAGIEADLLHARFALADRKRHEAKALQTYGKARVARPERVLVATQIVESSLDLDFDVMVSDLAPMAALIQRAGRLWRHMDVRPRTERPVPAPVLHVVSPDPDGITTSDWLVPAIGKGAYVYPQGLQWRTARTLFSTGTIEAPEALRELIEAAHGEELHLPPCLVNSALRAEGEEGAARALAAQNVIDLRAGYRSGASGAEDVSYPTRLGRPQSVLILARRNEAGTLVPWSRIDGTPDWTVEACQMSEVQIGTHRLEGLDLPDQDQREIAEIYRRLPDWMAPPARQIVPVSDDGEICTGLMYSPDRGLLRRSPQTRG